MERIENFYCKKKIFLTGATGFKGAWLCLLLQRLGAEVFNYSLQAPSTPSLWELLHLENICHHTHGDIRDKEALRRAMHKANPHICIHLAAQSLVRPSYEHPYDTFSTNIMGTAAVLEAALFCENLKATLIITSDKAYHNIGSQHSYEEKDRMGGDDPYSASKGAAELVVYAYRKSFFSSQDKGQGKGLATARAGNVIGGGDFATDRLIPDMAKAFKNNTPVELRYPQATRPWQHVLDPLYGYLLLAKALYENPHCYSEGWNFGPLNHEVHTVEEVVRLFTQQWNLDKEQPAHYTVQSQHMHEAHFLGLNCQKAHERLLWSPRISFEQSIQWTSTWYKAWAQQSTSLHNICNTQLNTFLHLPQRCM